MTHPHFKVLTLYPGCCRMVEDFFRSRPAAIPACQKLFRNLISVFCCRHMSLAAAAASFCLQTTRCLNNGVPETLPLSTSLAKLLPEKPFQEQKLAIGYRSQKRMAHLLMNQMGTWHLWIQFPASQLL